MSILIAGMEMPKAEFGSMIVAIRPDGMVEDVMGCYVGKAVTVPPHGLIDRGQILDSIRIELAQANAVNDMEDYDSWMRFFDYVRKFPTVIPASGTEVE